MAGHKTFRNDSFPGSSGISLANIPATYTEGGSPAWAVASGTWTANGSGSVVSGTGSTAVPNAPFPPDGSFDLLFNLGKPGGDNAVLYSNNGSADYYQFTIADGSIAVTSTAGGSNYSLATYSGTFSGTHDYAISFRRQPGGSNIVAVGVDGTTLGTFTDPHPPSLTASPAVGALASGGQTGHQLNSFGVALPAAATATLAPPSSTSGTAGVESGAFTTTLDRPAGTGGQAVNLASSVSGDTFHATAGGSAITSITIANGATTGTFLLVPSAAGSRNVSITSTGLTVSGSPVAYTATAAPQQTTNATGYTLAVSAASITTGVPETITATLTGGTVLSATLTINLADAAAATISGPITITNGSTTGTATITPSVVGTHNVTGTHTGGGFTGGDGSTSFTTTAAPVNGVTSSVTGFATGLTTVGYTGYDGSGNAVGPRSTAGVRPTKDGKGYITSQAPNAVEIVWDDGLGDLASDEPTYISAGTVNVSPLTSDQTATLAALPAFMAMFTTARLTVLDILAAGIAASAGGATQAPANLAHLLDSQQLTDFPIWVKTALRQYAADGTALAPSTVPVANSVAQVATPARVAAIDTLAANQALTDIPANIKTTLRQLAADGTGLAPSTTPVASSVALLAQGAKTSADTAATAAGTAATAAGTAATAASSTATAVAGGVTLKAGTMAPGTFLDNVMIDGVPLRQVMLVLLSKEGGTVIGPGVTNTNGATGNVSIKSPSGLAVLNAYLSQGQRVTSSLVPVALTSITTGAVTTGGTTGTT